MSSFAFMRWFDIKPDGEVSLSRLRVIDSKWGGLFLHKHVRGDPDPDTHDHPWWFVSIVLWGGYVEEVQSFSLVDKNAQRRVRWFTAKRADCAHRILWLTRSPTWTLVIHGPRVREWGFWKRLPPCALFWIPWKMYVEERERMARRR